MTLRLARPPESVAELAERLLLGTVTLRREEAILNTPRATLHEISSDDASRAGVAAAASVLCICLDEVDGTRLDHGIARDISRRMIRAYLDQVERIGGRR